MIEQKAVEYAAKICDVAEFSEMPSWFKDSMASIAQNAYRAGYQAGQTDAHRKEFVVEQPTHFERGMT